jgi:hypothetical protein
MARPLEGVGVRVRAIGSACEPSRVDPPELAITDKEELTPEHARNGTLNVSAYLRICVSAYLRICVSAYLRICVRDRALLA